MQEAAQCLDLLTVGLELRLLCRKYSLVPTTVKSWCGARQAMTIQDAHDTWSDGFESPNVSD